ncbi:hypothetical protein COS81_02060 [candidate division WWE3 bacterium CG06_land_8_20_14_3_00_42_16]|uniref:Uncharacterized protein n=2 Tax=Katanobacteria TaxID=422282 RepID=A0A2M7ANI6_UNCKA|nr:MAG: hypothetical protein COS81_02060 [candidate division WWE3 bacterium CG06_land_8_20_14_3_00_42_16]PJA37366.1 MAG: hypothetical protein CO181_03820 [candidate division WWE3 bacterium CG_4_9_14_3_um_filter_43_9]
MLEFSLINQATIFSHPMVRSSWRTKVKVIWFVQETDKWLGRGENKNVCFLDFPAGVDLKPFFAILI